MNDFEGIIKRMSVTRLEPGDYTGEDGLLYCGKCRTPKQFRLVLIKIGYVLTQILLFPYSHSIIDL